MYYQAQVPKNSSELPVGNAAAFKAMLQSFSKKKSSSNMSIWVRLDKPIYHDEAFWDTGEGISDQHFDYSTAEAPDSSLTSTLGAQKASFDEASKPHLQILHETYPVGNKPVFGTNIRVFTNSTGDSWELNDMRLNVWASHMARKTAGVDEHHPPSSTWFDHGNCIKITPTPSVPPALPPYPLATTSAPVPSLPPAQPDFRDRLLDIMLLKLMGGDVHASLLSATSAPLPPSLPTSPARLSRISLEAFCNHYGISEIDQERLAELEYRPGNPAIELLEAAEWTAVGFKCLSWAEIVNTHKRFLKDVKTGLWNHILS
ncbi:hypothetical protein F5878DRAFT_666626 [Lentinula raphanica]|uniref:Uncharacterized protein n=1 Tax=Lentinula raphanica TaxID=153919 RepID=A0AA38U536_9AGAR|nr:hypothetical protein F5878DRAFT_666626 [Lentinula raphanica]